MFMLKLRRFGELRSAVHLLALLACSVLCASCAVSNGTHPRSGVMADLPVLSAEEDEALGFTSNSREQHDGFANDRETPLRDSDLRDNGKGSAPKEQDSTQRKMVYTGTLVLGVGDAARARKELRELCEALGGYIQSERDSNIVLRIPAAEWQAGIDQVGRVGREISRQIDVQDVTEQYVDLELRVKNARALRDRLEQLLQKAEDVKAALEVERELTRVRLEIEQIEAMLRSLGQRVSFGTLQVTLRTLAQVPRNSADLPFAWLKGLGVEHLLSRRGAR